MRRLRQLLFLAILLTAGVTLAQSSAAGDSAESRKLEAGLREAVAAAGTVDVTIYLTARADLSAAATITDWRARGDYVVDTLQATARTDQRDLLVYLNRQARSGSVTHIRPFFIVNAVMATVDAATLNGVTALPQVARVVAQRQYALPPVTPDAAVAAVEWGVERINAPAVWSDYGTIGAGVVVMNNDTGVDIDHPALINQYRGWDGATFNHDYNFYDPSGTCGGAPCDNNDHGTHTMGIMVGDDSGANQIGVAPGATWIAGKGCENFFCTDASLLAVAEWALAPCPWGVAPGDPACDAGLRPHVINNSWGGGGGDSWFQAAVDAWQASGIVPVFSAGNSGPGAGTIGTPGDYCNVIGVGATDSADAIASFSSRGPGGFVDCQEKPDVSAPGAAVRSSVNGGGYELLSGTSMAAPHVAGCIALLKAIDPAVDYDRAYDLLTTTAVDLGAPGFDYDFGNGRIDCFAAASQLDPTFRVQVAPAAVNVCVGTSAATTVTALSIAGFDDGVALDDGGAGGTFGATVVTPPGSTSYTLGTTGLPAGAHPVTITGTSTVSGTVQDSAEFTAHIFDAAPGTPTLDAPADDAVDVALIPTLIWTSGGQASKFDVGIFTSPTLALNTLVDYALGLTTTSWAPAVTLDPLTTYYWAVRAKNPCGLNAVSTVFSFTTRDIPTVLLVDDDDNVPDVSFFYTEALDANGIAYDIWDTNNSDNEPSAQFMSQYNFVIWFTGNEFGGFAGPGSSSEAAIAAYLDAGEHCFWISSQDYLWDRGGDPLNPTPTPLMTDYLGVASGVNDVSHTSVTGILPPFGSYTLNYPFTNYSDRLTRSAGTNLMYVGNNGDAALYKLGGSYASSYWGFAFEALPFSGRATMMGRIVTWCQIYTATGVNILAAEP